MNTNNNDRTRNRNPRSNSSQRNAPRGNPSRPARYEEPKNNDYDEYDDRPQTRQPRRTREDDYDDRDYYPETPRSKSKLLYVLLGIGCVAVVAGATMLLTGNSNAEIISVAPNYITTQQAYQDCHKEGTTSYVRNQKNGTEGALIGGATGAVAGGVIGNQVHGGGGGTVVGALVGGGAGALIGRDVQRSNQPDYVARRGSTTKCATAYRPVQTQVGYNVQYMYKNNMATIVTQNPLALGSKIPFNQLEAMAVPAQQLNPAPAQ